MIQGLYDYEPALFVSCSQQKFRLPSPKFGKGDCDCPPCRESQRNPKVNNCIELTMYINVYALHTLFFLHTYSYIITCRVIVNAS